MKRLQLFLLMLIALPIGMLAAGTSWQTATLIENGATGKGSLSSKVNEQWHKIVVSENGVIKLTVTPASELSLYYVTLYSVVDNETKSRNSLYFGGSSKKTLEVKDVAAGTYYIKTERSGGEGSFTIKYSFTATSSSFPNDKEVNDTYKNASTLKLGTNTTGQLGYYYWDDRDTKDFHKIVVPENGTLQLTLAPNGELTIYYMTLYALKDSKLQSRNSLYFGNGDTKTLEVKDIAAGTYYVLIERSGGQGGYRLTCNFSYQKALYPNDNEPNDTYDKASELKSGTNTGHLGYNYWDNRDTKDFHKIVVTENGTIQLKLTPQKDELSIYYMTLYALKDGELKSRNSLYFGNSAEKTLEVTDIAAGTYYVLIEHSGGQGGYTLSYNFTPLSAQYPNDNEPNDTYDKASLVKRGNTITGQLGHYYWDDRDNKDYHKIEVPRDGTIKLTLAPKGELSIYYMTLYALKDGALKSRNSLYFGNGETKTLQVDNMAPGTYYILIERSGGQGGYTLEYKFEQNLYATDAEPNDTYDKAVSLAKGKTVAGHLGYLYYDDTDSKDWYKIKVASKGDITLTAKPYGTLTFYYITLYASDGTTNKGSVYYGNSDQKQLTVKNMDAGTYYVKVERSGGCGYYFLAYASTIGSVEKQEELPDEVSGTVTLDKTEVVVRKNKTVTLKATVAPETLTDKSVKWKSSDKTIATVSSSGKVTGVKSGVVTITCTSVATGAEATCKVIVGTITLDKSEAVVKKKSSITLTPTVYPTSLEDKSVKWKSSDKTIATVSSSGKVTGVKSGVVTITCTSNATGLSATCTVTVGTITLNKSSVTVNQGKTVTLTPTVYPTTLEDQTVKWQSSDKSVATVTSAGKVKGVKPGVATITCTSNATGLSTTCTVTVPGVVLDQTEVVVKKKNTLTLTPTFYPETLEDKSVTWKSSDKEVATVSADGVVKGVKSGVVTITCTSNATGAKATCKVTVGTITLSKSSATIIVGKTLKLTSTVYPTTLEDQSVTWKSSKKSVAKVSSTGKVTAVKAGTATITCTSNATGLSATCKITVKASASARTLDEEDAELTDIEIVEVTPAVVEPFDVYDLRGHRVLHQVTSLDGLSAGVYIVNGKKVLKK